MVFKEEMMTTNERLTMNIRQPRRQRLHLFQRGGAACKGGIRGGPRRPVRSVERATQPCVMMNARASASPAKSGMLITTSPCTRSG